MDYELYYDMIQKRKSFHEFGEIGTVSEEELEDIRAFLPTITPHYDDIKVEMQIVKEEETTCNRGAEYCILFYSEKKDNYLQNIGYMCQQADLYLVSKDMGTLWFGIGHPKEKNSDLSYVIMLAFAKKPDGPWRRDMFAAKRKELSETWSGPVPEYANIARFTPSACNSQPWYVESSDHGLTVYRKRKPGKVGIMPIAMVPYFNRIDMGIYFCILEVCLHHFGQDYERVLYVDGEDSKLTTLNAEYKFK